MYRGILKHFLQYLWLIYNYLPRNHNTTIIQNVIEANLSHKEDNDDGRIKGKEDKSMIINDKLRREARREQRREGKVIERGSECENKY